MAMGMGGMPSYGGVGGFGLMGIDPTLMQALAQRPEFGALLDSAGIPAPQMPMGPAMQPGLGDILGGVLGGAGPAGMGGGVGGGGAGPAGGMATAPTPQVAQPQGQQPVRLMQQNAPTQGKMPGNPLMDLMMQALLSGQRPGLGR